VIGDHGGNGQPASRMTIPRSTSGPPEGGRRRSGNAAITLERTSALPRFVTVRAGAYLFIPGLTALRFLARQRAGR